MNLAVLAIAVVGGTARADDGAVRDTNQFASMTIDNDFFAGYDQHYTNGLQIAFSAAKAALPESIRSLPPFRWSSDPRFTLAVGQRIYTPANTNRVDADPRDRPYGGWLYVLADVRILGHRTEDSVQASVGIMGPAALAEQTQNFYHRLIGSEEARGWDAQVDNQITFLFGYERAWPSLMSRQVGGLTLDFTPRVGATVGNVYTYANSGAVIRLGQNLPNDYPVTNISLGPPRDGYRPSAPRLGWYIWFGTEARLVGWNAFLDRGPAGSGPGVERRYFGYDLQFGVATVWKKARVGFAIVKRSEEFRTQLRDDKFGQLNVSFRF